MANGGCANCDCVEVTSDANKVLGYRQSAARFSGDFFFLRSLPAALLAPFFISLVILLSKINLWKTLCHNYQTFLNGTSFFERLSCDPPM